MSELGCIDTHQYVRGNKWSRSITLSSSFYRHLITLTTLLSNPDTTHHVTCTFTTHGVCVTVDRCECRYMWCMSRIFYILTLLTETMVKHLLVWYTCISITHSHVVCTSVESVVCTHTVGRGTEPWHKIQKTVNFSIYDTLRVRRVSIYIWNRDWNLKTYGVHKNM